MDVEVLLKGVETGLSDHLAAGIEMCYRVEGDTLPVNIPPAISLLRTVYIPPPARNASESVQGSRSRLYPVVALGGTFDHLHAGHKILLSMGAWTASRKLIVGVTDDALLVSKAYCEVLEPIQVRMDRVRTFLLRFKPSLEYDIVPISDVYGPTGWDANIQALVVSTETLPGAASIASRRESLGLPPLETFVIDVISPTSSELDPKDIELLKKAKMSSTFIRKWIVCNRSA
jgi:pantetheine-phosphate adenylyltransferase